MKSCSSCNAGWPENNMCCLRLHPENAAKDSASNTIVLLTDDNDSQDDNKTTNTSMREILGTEYTQQDHSSTLSFGLYFSLAHEMDTSTSNSIPTVAGLTANATMTALNSVTNPTTTTMTSHGGSPHD
eukprot:12533435-Ditylum_brightwellii.AAC.1